MLDVYEELAETSRRLILLELRGGPKNVTDLVEATGLKQPNVSNHLCRMRQRNIVCACKAGRQVYYSLATPEIEAIVHSAFLPSQGPQNEVDTDELAKRYAKAAIQGDEAGCLEVMDAAFRARLPLIDIYQDVLSVAMAHVGNWYKVEAIDEAHEHLASYLTERMMARTMQVIGPTRRHDRVAILGCAPNGWHVIGLRMIGDYLRFCGWRTLYLGANVPQAAFLSAVTQHSPNMVLLSCSADVATDETIGLLGALRAQRGRRCSFVIGLGGYCVERNPERFERAGADFTAKDLREFATRYLPEIERCGRAPEDGCCGESV
jgi:methanogenic corrinoid protein MtbC1